MRKGIPRSRILARAFALCAGALVLAAISPVQAGVLAIENVNVVSMRDERVDRDQTVVVRGDRIESIGDASSAVIPPGALHIDGRGFWLFPGLIDSHVHIRMADLPAYLASGITTVRDLAGLDSVLQIARRVASGELSGPRIVTASLLINGPDPRAPAFATVITSPSQADATVATQLERGCRWIKLYENLPIPVYDAVVRAARARGAPIAGHVSVFVDVRHAIESQDSIEHLSGYERAVTLVANAAGQDIGAWQRVDRSRYADLAQLSADKGVWNCPTLYVYAVLSGFSAPIIENRRAFVLELYLRGAHILAGTDAGYLVPAGSSLHEEIGELLASGMSPADALAAATREAARFLDMLDEIGTIEEGKRADLLLVAGNPLEDPAVLRHPMLVVVRGEVTGTRRRSAQH